MKQTMKIVSLALCAAVMLSVPVLAAETAPDTETAPIADTVQTAADPGLKGAVTKLENGSLLINDETRGEVIVHLPEGVPFMDGTTGTAMDTAQIKDGDVLQIWTSPVMTMSLPPQTSAEMLVGNVPADHAPQFAEVTAPAVLPASNETERRVLTNGGELTVLETAEVSPYLNKRIVTLEDLTPGAQILAWTNADGKVHKIVLLPYAYSGYMTASEDGAMYMDGEELPVKGRMIESEEMTRLYLPLRAAAEAAGYDVEWVSGKGAVVSQYGTELFSVQSGSDTAQTPDGEHGLLGGCVIDNGVTYLPADDLAFLLNLYFYNA